MIYVFLANGFEEVEALTPIDFLRRCELDVRTVGVNGEVAIGSHRIPVGCDLTVDEIDITKADAVILPGGMPGTLNLEASPVVKEAVLWCRDHDKWIGAICAAPSVLGHLGVLEGKKATCFPGFEQELKGAEHLTDPVVRDGKIITSRGAGTASQFAFALIEALCSPEQAARMKASVQWQE
ncbi:MAG: DJ-1 family glyoxalase III [Candidatus Merdivicinus sp.]|jgi:4-methyl-5(b-hydroxyethyl)-thiazole monophosphate biosynthesis